jgi:hypothetical protein
LEAKWNSGKRKFVVTSDDQIFSISEGLQLRGMDAKDDVERIAELRGKRVVNVRVLARFRRIFAFPQLATPRLPSGVEFALKGRAARPLTVCRPPHVIVSAARNFAVFSNTFLVVPARQIGVVSVTNDIARLKALALYLSSDFAFFHQFLVAPQLGVKREVATLEALRQMPIPIHNLSSAELEPWVHLHDQLAETEPRRLRDEDTSATGEVPSDNQPKLLRELNALVSSALGIDERDDALAHDFVHVRLALADGNVGYEAGRKPTSPEIQTYARWLRRELDNFIGESTERRHAVTVIYDAHSAMVAVDFTKDREAANQIRVLEASTADARTLEHTRQRLRTERAQWVYFDRALRIYEGRKTYLFKPRQRFHWTRTQAMIDAGEIIADTLASTPA